jgi:membrane protein insertase Oxa1/YidC/SpoIIIJ
MKIRKDRRELLTKLKQEQTEELAKLTDEEQIKMSKFNYLLKQTEIFSINYGRTHFTTKTKKK